MNRLFVANKPSGVSSNRYLSALKRKYGARKGGFSGTLDPFASGTLVVALGETTRLFRFMNFEPKRYIATLWLGASSPSLDNENIAEVADVPPLPRDLVADTIATLTGKIEFIPPKFSAKNIAGRRAYDLARAGVEFELAPCTMEIYSARLLHYCHPFVTYEIALSRGGYVRSHAQMVAGSLGMAGTLSALHRASEGNFIYENERAIDIKSALNLSENVYLKSVDDLKFGRPLERANFKTQNDGKYLINLGENLYSIIEISAQKVSYLLNGITL